MSRGQMPRRVEFFPRMNDRRGRRLGRRFKRRFGITPREVQILVDELGFSMVVGTFWHLVRAADSLSSEFELMPPRPMLGWETLDAARIAREVNGEQS